LGGAGLLLPERVGPELVAEAIDRIVRDDALRRDLVQRGRRRLEDITRVDASVAMLRAIAEVV
jgi:hypothetical protein